MTPEWFKIKGYLHLSPQTAVLQQKMLIKRIMDKDYVGQYAFYPLIHKIIKERKYKKGNLAKNGTLQRAHKHLEEGKIKSTAKNRPLHYATHKDALIYSYYAAILGDIYYNKIQDNKLLDAAITAYRKIPIQGGIKEGKSSVHFAKEAFDIITEKVYEWGECYVLAFDLKSFFSTLDHKYLKALWIKLLHEHNPKEYSATTLRNDHYNVYKACTNFSYVMLNDLKSLYHKHPHRYNESYLASIRKQHGIKSFFASNEDFRLAIKDGLLPIYKNHFFKKLENGKQVNYGIPQGLPISAVLANIYMSEFDAAIIHDWTLTKGCIYRRYSDDMLFICKKEDYETLNKYVNEKIKSTHVAISPEKTEIFTFKIDEELNRITSYKLKEKQWVKNTPLTYLGFEFRGYNVTIKSASLAKYYRRMIYLVKRRAKRVEKIVERDPIAPKVIFRRRLEKLYNLPLKHDPDKYEFIGKKMKYNKVLKLNSRGFYEYKIIGERKKKYNSNYITYINKCCKIFGNDIFKHQIRKRKKIVNEAIKRYC